MDEPRIAEEIVPSVASENTVALVNLITEIGPDIAEISRRLGQFKESVRYRYKEKLVKRRFQVKANIDYGALGLTRVVMKLRVSRQHRKEAHQLFRTLSDVSYVVAYAGTMPGDLYIVHAAVPSEFAGEFRGLMEALKQRGIFASVELFDCGWFRMVPMRADCFDFDAGVWDFDWGKPPPADEKAARATITERKSFDKIDLLLLKELSKDSDRSLTEIQATIEKVNGVDINYKTLGWHYAHHVLGHRLVRDYSVVWHGLNYNHSTGLPEGYARYDYLGVALIVHRVSDVEKMMLRGELNRLPFLWSEASGEAYTAQLHIPLGSANEALEYLKGVLEPYQARAEIFFLDKREMLSFTVCYNLWDESEDHWTFDPSKVLAHVERSALNVRERAV